jgi:hypothetical protein
MLPLAQDEDYRARWSLVEKHFCSRPNSRDGTPLVIRDYEGMKELSFVFFTGWLFCGVLNSDKDLVRPAILPMGKAGESSVLALYELTTHLAAPARRGSLLLDPDYFVCPLDRAGRALTPTETHLCPVVNKLRYNLAHAKDEWDVSGLVEPSKTQECCASGKDLLWSYLAATVCRDPDLYGPMIGGSAFPINLQYDVLSEYLTGVNPGTRDFGTLLEETLLWFAMAKSGVLVGAAHTIVEKPFKSNEIDILLYECAGKHKAVTDPPDGWAKHLEEQAICVLELTIGHQPEPASNPRETDAGRRGGRRTEGNDAPKNKLINFLAFRSIGFKHVEFHYLSVIADPSMAEATKQALECTDGFRYTFLPTILGEDVGGAVLDHRDNRVPVQTVRRWHDALIKAVESIGEEFAKKLA